MCFVKCKFFYGIITCILISWHFYSNSCLLWDWIVMDYVVKINQLDQFFTMDKAHLSTSESYLNQTL